MLQSSAETFALVRSHKVRISMLHWISGRNEICGSTSHLYLVTNLASTSVLLRLHPLSCDTRDGPLRSSSHCRRRARSLHESYMCLKCPPPRPILTIPHLQFQAADASFCAEADPAKAPAASFRHSNSCCASISQVILSRLVGGYRRAEALGRPFAGLEG